MRQIVHLHELRCSFKYLEYHGVGYGRTNLCEGVSSPEISFSRHAPQLSEINATRFDGGETVLKQPLEVKEMFLDQQGM